MNGGWHKSALAVLCLLLTASCATSRLYKQSDPIHKTTAKEREDTKTYLDFLKSEKQALSGEYEKAHANIKKVIEATPDSGFLYYELATYEASQENVPAAIEACEKALELSPKLVEAHLLLGRLYSADGKSKEAANIFENVIKDFPQEKESYPLLANEYIKLERYKEAIGTMQRLMIITPESNLANYYLGLIYGSYLKKYDKAIDAYNKVLESDPDSMQIYSAIAQIYLDQKKRVPALKVLLKMEKLAPEDIAIQLKIALIYYDMKKYDDAADRFEKILKWNPESDKIRYYLAVIYSMSNRMDDSIRHFRQLPASSTFIADAYLQVAQHYFQNKDIDKVGEVLNEAMSKKPDEPDFYKFLGGIYENEGRMEESIEVLEKGQKALPANEDILFLLGVAYDRMDRFDDALKMMNKVVALNPKNASALNYVGYTYADRGTNLDKAEDMLQEAISIRPDDGFIMDSLGWLYFKKGDLTKASELLQQASKLVPEEAAVYEHLGDVYYKRNDTKKALKLYKKAVECSKKRKRPDEGEVKRIEAKVCEVGGC